MKKFQPHYDELIKQGCSIDDLYNDIKNIWTQPLSGYAPCANNFDDLQELSLYLFLLNNTQQATTTEINNRLGRRAKVASYRPSWTKGICLAINKLYYQSHSSHAAVVPSTIIDICNKMGYLGKPEAEQFLELLNNFQITIDFKGISFPMHNQNLVIKIASRYPGIKFNP